MHATDADSHTERAPNSKTALILPLPQFINEKLRERVCAWKKMCICRRSSHHHHRHSFGCLRTYTRLVFLAFYFSFLFCACVRASLKSKTHGAHLYTDEYTKRMIFPNIFLLKCCFPVGCIQIIYMHVYASYSVR